MPRRRTDSKKRATCVDDHRREAFGRLVDHHEFRVAHERTAKREHLLLAAREHARRRRSPFPSGCGNSS